MEKRYSFDKCKNCHKLRQQGDLYFCGGCGYGSQETPDQSKWEEITLIELKKE